PATGWPKAGSCARHPSCLRPFLTLRDGDHHACSFVVFAGIGAVLASANAGVVAACSGRRACLRADRLYPCFGPLFSGGRGDRLSPDYIEERSSPQAPGPRSDVRDFCCRLFEPCTFALL